MSGEDDNDHKAACKDWWQVVFIMRLREPMSHQPTHKKTKFIQGLGIKSLEAFSLESQVWHY